MVRKGQGSRQDRSSSRQVPGHGSSDAAAHGGHGVPQTSKTRHWPSDSVPRVVRDPVKQGSCLSRQRNPRRTPSRRHPWKSKKRHPRPSVEQASKTSQKIRHGTKRWCMQGDDTHKAEAMLCEGADPEGGQNAGSDSTPRAVMPVGVPVITTATRCRGRCLRF